MIQRCCSYMKFIHTQHIKEGVHLKTSTMKSLKREVADSHQCAKYKVEDPAMNSSTAHKWTSISTKIHQRIANKRRHIEFFVCNRKDTLKYHGGFRSWKGVQKIALFSIVGLF